MGLGVVMKMQKLFKKKFERKNVTSPTHSSQKIRMFFAVSNEKIKLTRESGHWFYVNTSFFCFIQAAKSIDCSVPFFYI